MAAEIDEWVKTVRDGRVNVLITSWWQEINDSVLWQDAIFFTLSALFAIVSFAALVTFFLF